MARMNEARTKIRRAPTGAPSRVIATSNRADDCGCDAKLRTVTRDSIDVKTSVPGIAARRTDATAVLASHPYVVDASAHARGRSGRGGRTCVEFVCAIVRIR